MKKGRKKGSKPGKTLFPETKWETVVCICWDDKYYYLGKKNTKCEMFSTPVLFHIAALPSSSLPFALSSSLLPLFSLLSHPSSPPTHLSFLYPLFPLCRPPLFPSFLLFLLCSLSPFHLNHPCGCRVLGTVYMCYVKLTLEEDDLEMNQTQSQPQAISITGGDKCRGKVTETWRKKLQSFEKGTHTGLEKIPLSGRPWATWLATFELDSWSW